MEAAFYAHGDAHNLYASEAAGFHEAETWEKDVRCEEKPTPVLQNIVDEHR